MSPTKDWIVVSNGNFFIIGPNSVITEEMLPLLRDKPNIHKLTYWVNRRNSYPGSSSSYNYGIDLRLGAPRHEFERIEKLYARFFPRGA